MTDRSREARTRIAAWIEQALPSLGPAWLPEQRWFGAKSRTIADVRVEDIVWLPADAETAAVVVLEVHYAADGHATSAARDRYTLIVRADRHAPEAMVIATLPDPGAVVFEAATDRAALRALLGGLSTGTPLTGARGGEIAYADASAQVRRLVTPGGDEFPAVKPVGLEQSNTSVRIGSTHVFKLFRRLEEGAHPQLEIGRFLSHTSFRGVPMLEGSLVYTPRGGEGCALGVLEAWVENQGDGWSYVVGELERTARAGSDQGHVVADIFVLGTITAEFHLALASDDADPAFAPETITGADRRDWHGHLLAQAERAFALIERQAVTRPEPVASLARRVLQHRARAAQLLDSVLRDPQESFMRIRTHGDYHLGQTLKTRDGFAIIDFEGEPTRPLAVRRQKHSALRDVAGMLRSIEYAVATANARVSGTHDRPLTPDRLRDGFVDGYRSKAMIGGASFLPSSAGALHDWLLLFELEKALYEVEYELNNRPDWVVIPLRGVAALTGG